MLAQSYFDVLLRFRFGATDFNGLERTAEVKKKQKPNKILEKKGRERKVDEMEQLAGAGSCQNVATFSTFLGVYLWATSMFKVVSYFYLLGPRSNSEPTRRTWKPNE